MDIRLDGRRALITGGSAGLGLAMAKTFARSGAAVAIAARRHDVLEAARAEIAAAGGPVHAVAADVSSPADCERAFRSSVDALGGVDILVNNAGTSAAGAFEAVTDEEWQADLDLKLFAAIRLCRLALPAMRAQRWGRIINVLNIGAKTPGRGSAPTTVTRAAGMALTKVLAGEAAADGVLVNALCTGVLVTEQWGKLHQRRGGELGFEEFLERTGRAVPIGRMGDPQEFANLACFLASDAASFVTGCAINVDGGASPVV
ncbi:MAG: SDR family NAD(P)-dependent oxidoreductase [Acidimicrobiales bacterium]